MKHDEQDTCQRCEKRQAFEQYDHYGIYAGKMCDKCFKEAYKQGAYYDYLDAGEYLEPDDY